MDGEQAFFAFGGEHQQFDLSALDEVNHLVLIAARVYVGMARDFDRMGIQRFALERIAQLLFELVGVRRLLNGHRVSFQCPHDDRW
jgi:hypothetical protein